MKNYLSVSSSLRRSSHHLAVATLIGLCSFAGSGAVRAQDTAGAVFGKAPAGDSVSVVSNSTGLQREVHVGKDGRYALRALPVAVYTVTLLESGKPVMKHLNVPIVAGRGIKVDFDSAASEE
ncbi:MAG: carboxypeptidase-like regulatory domain-containing protein [Dyella sp.]|uniref:carboxypeptidase-like regulatory domain-containing protein n=1 Tax=Dyella sp. TaxID=1869338 RepID=UPI003F7F4D9B